MATYPIIKTFQYHCSVSQGIRPQTMASGMDQRNLYNSNRNKLGM